MKLVESFNPPVIEGVLDGVVPLSQSLLGLVSSCELSQLLILIPQALVLRQVRVDWQVVRRRRDVELTGCVLYSTSVDGLSKRIPADVYKVVDAFVVLLI